MNRNARKRVLFVAVALFLAGIALALVRSAASSALPAPPSVDLTVSAAISLKDALDSARQSYISAHPDVHLAMNYGASGTLQLQIEQGAPVDVYISAAPQQMDALAAKGLLLEGTRHDLLRNEIVLIVPKGTTGVSSFQDLLKPAVRHVALGEPASVPAGKYAQEVLKYFAIADQVNAKAVLAKDVRQVLTYVETGDADAGIVYATDALSSSQVSVVAKAPADSHDPVIYPVAVIKDSKSPEAAKAFEAFLSSEQSLAIFEKYGFTAASR
jgi:molybdate transport system substrate-binding protein